MVAVLQPLATAGDSGTIAVAAIILAGDPHDITTSGDSGTISATVAALEGGYYVYTAYAEPSTGHLSVFAWLDGGYVEPDVQAAPTDGCGIKQLYERSLMGYYPLYFYDLTTLAHKGWYPHWCVMWIENAAGGASWRERTNDTSIWNERTNSAAAWRERA